jgi:hypothetical protein
MSLLSWVIIAFVCGIGVAGTTAIIISTKKSGASITNAWIKIRPIISEVLIEAMKVYQADKLGYDALVSYCVGYTKRKVNAADFLLEEEKELLTEEFIRGIIEPQLKKLWEQKMLEVGL